MGEALRYLNEYEGSRENNFTVLRTVFALLVLYGHSFPISGNGSDPITKLMLPITWIGGLAVGGFFAISGFLVTASFVRRGPAQYLISRGLRLYPAIIVYCLVAIFIIGPMGSSVGIAEYFSTDFGAYFKNASLWSWKTNLPYNFEDRPFRGGTNGSMWTLPVEIRSYLIIFALGLAGVFKSRITANITILLLYYIIVCGGDLSFFFGEETRYRHPLSFFFVGCLAWINRDLIPLSGLLGAILLLGQFSFLSTPYWLIAHSIAVSYAILYVVYRLPHIDIDRKFGDISFGVYIYAWPIQQMVWYPQQSGLVNALLATVVVVPIAYMSWRFVESPALRIKQWTTDRQLNPRLE